MIVDFTSWNQATLAQFAVATKAELLEQEATIKQLRDDLRAALDSYRALVMTSASH